MTIEILMPAVGAGTTHGKIIQWCKQVGDAVAVGDVLAEIETDKAVIELEAFDEGTLQAILVPAGDEEVPVGQAVAILAGTEQADDAPSQAAAVATEREPVTEHEPATGQEPVRQPVEMPAPAPEAIHPVAHRKTYFASPSARHLARQLDIDIADIEGSGPGGRIVRVDIEKAARSVPKQAVQPAVASLPMKAGSTIPHSNIRKTIARRLQEAKRDIPHFYLSIDCDMDQLLGMRQQVNGKRDSSLKLSVNDILVYAIARAVAKVPAINRQWAPDAIIENGSIDISVAVSTDAGLITPIVRDADRKNLSEVATELSGLVHKARDGRLKPDEYQGGSVTVSNLGMFGIKEFSAIINPPQAAILAVGAVSPQAVVKNGELAIAHVMTITLSADHRVIDGAIGAQFLSQLKELLETPYLLLA